MIPKLVLAMDFSERLATLRKQKGLTQQALAERVGLHVLQIRRYESGASQPSLPALRKLAVALAVSADMLVFDKDERGPDDEFRLQFEAIAQLAPDEKKVVKAVLDGLILRHQAKRWSSA